MVYFFPARKHCLMVFRNYEYVLEKRNATSTNWHCASQIKNKCTARVTTRSNVLTWKNIKHNHAKSNRDLDKCYYSNMIKIVQPQKNVPNKKNI